LNNLTGNTELNSLNKLIITLETISTSSKRDSMLKQVAQSKGTEWMVSNYNTWQQRSPLCNIPSKKTFFLNQLKESSTQKEERMGRIMALSFRSVLLILGLIISMKGK
jgi:hypothetical protein